MEEGLRDLLEALPENDISFTSIASLIFHHKV